MNDNDPLDLGYMAALIVVTGFAMGYLAGYVYEYIASVL